MKNIRKMAALFCCLTLVLTLFTGCSGEKQPVEEAQTESAETRYKIGVAQYSHTDPEQRMFWNYYKTYIGESFPVEFVQSDALMGAEDELNFIHTAAENGVKAIISFYGLDLKAAVEACEAEEIYYVLGSASISDEAFNEVKDNPWFLGVIGPNEETEYNTGAKMAAEAAANGATSFLLISGGAGGQGNYMHYTRILGAVQTLESKLGINLGMTAEELAASEELTAVTSPEGVTIVVSPGYVQFEEGITNLEKAFADYDYDAVISAIGLNDVEQQLKDEIASSEKICLVGVVDCFSEENLNAVTTEDANGNALINYVSGKYASMIAPAFVAVYNAMSGHADVVNPGGEAFRIYQSYWEAASPEEFQEEYEFSQSIYINAYSNADLMSVLYDYNPEVTFEAFETLSSACDIDAVKARLEK